MSLVLRGGQVVGGLTDAAAGTVQATSDVRIADGRIIEVAASIEPGDGDEIIDCKGQWICPGFVDLWARVGEPGHEYREDIETASRAAAAGGYVTLCTVPDSQPINDCRAVTELLISRGRSVGGARIMPVAAATMGLQSAQLVEMGELAQAGAVAVSTAEDWISSSGLLRRVLEYASTFELPVIVKPVDTTLCRSGVAHEGALATRLGLEGVPSQAETAALARDIELAELTGARLIVSHLSSARSVELVASAKARGVDVWATVSAAHLWLNEDECREYDPAAKLWPPLRTEGDRKALVEGLRAQVIDCIVSDHDPKAEVDKHHEFSVADAGGATIEAAAAVIFGLIRRGELPRQRAIDAMALAPLRALGNDAPGVAEGSTADLCIVDPDAEWEYTRADGVSRSVSSPLFGQRLRGRVTHTLVAGEPVFTRAREPSL